MDNIKRFMMPTDTHIGGWFFPEKLIDSIWDYWNNPSLKIQGLKSPGTITEENVFVVDKTAKDSIEKAIQPHNNEEPWVEYELLLQKCLEDYIKHYPASAKTDSFSIRDQYQVQWYPKNGGFKILHHENLGNSSSAHRHLVFMTYLNDIPDGGTHFPSQNITTPSIKGLTLIFPAYFTHPHKGQISKKHEKMIVTGWYNFNTLYDDLNKTSNNYV